MLDPIQILLTVVVTALTTLLVVIGIEVFRILQETKKTLDRVNNILDHVETVTKSLSKPVEGVSALIRGIKEGTGIARALMRIFKEHEVDDDEDEEA